MQKILILYACFSLLFKHSCAFKHFGVIKPISHTILSVVETVRDGMIELDTGGSICYDVIKADRHLGPPILYLPGLIRPKSEGKSVNLRSFCKKNGFSFLCADYWGQGKSSGSILDGTVSKWTADTIFLIENLLGQKQGKVVLVGHGVGAWISFLIASKRPDLVRGVVGIAADPDFTEELLWKGLPQETKDQIMTEGSANITWGGDGKYPISRKLIEDGRLNLLLTGGKGSIPIDCPIRLVHGLRDDQVPTSFALKLLDNCATRDAAITLLKSSTHSMEDPSDMTTMRSMILEVMSNYKGDFDLRSPGSG
jgi:esterase/lipase